MSHPIESSPRRPSRSAALVAACRMLAADQSEAERLIADPFAHLVVDDAAVAAARADEPLQNVIRLRTRYIDDAIVDFVGEHGATRPQLLMLGAGLDTRAYRMQLDVDAFEVDFPATLELKAELLADVEPTTRRTVVPVDLATRGFVEPLVDAGFDVDRPTIVVWEGVSMYLDDATATSVVAQVAQATSAGSVLVADYAEMSWFKGSDFERTTKRISDDLKRDGEPLRAGLHDVRGTLHRNGFDVTDDLPTEHLRRRYGLAPLPRHYPTRIFTAVRRS